MVVLLVILSESDTPVSVPDVKSGVAGWLGLVASTVTVNPELSADSFPAESITM